MAKVRTGTRFATGRAGDVTLAAPGLLQFLRKASQANKDFDKELRKAAEEIAEIVVIRAKVNARAQPPHGKNNTSGKSQAATVVEGLRARRDRIPTIKLDAKRGYPSKSRTNRRRTKTVQGPFLPGMRKTGFTTMGDVFFGAEFGGRRRKTTQQFLRHRGRSGYFFWHAVRDSKSYIAVAYQDAIDLVLKRLAAGAG